MPRCVAGNISAATPFPFHDYKASDCRKRRADGVACCGVCAGAARAGDAPGANCAAKSRPCSLDELHADRGCSARRHRRAARNHDRTRAGIARRPAGEIRWRAVPSAGCRPRDARADPSGRDHAGDSAAWQPRRRSLGAAKVRFLSLRACRFPENAHARPISGRFQPSLLDRHLGDFLYAAVRDREGGLDVWRGSSAG